MLMELEKRNPELGQAHPARKMFTFEIWRSWIPTLLQKSCAKGYARPRGFTEDCQRKNQNRIASSISKRAAENGQ